MPRSIWKGSISFGLVNIPIKVYSATQAKLLSFKVLDKEGHPVEYKRWCPVCKREIEWKEVKKGFKVAKNKFIVLEKKDFERIKLRTTKAIEVQEFVDASQIDPIYVQKSYYLAPEEIGIKAYSLFCEALRLTGKAALAKVVMREKEYLVVIRSFRNGLVMHVLYYPEEVKKLEEIPELKELVAVREAERKLAQALIEKMSVEEVNLEKFKDVYSQELKELIKAKAEGREFKVEAKPEAEEAKELLEALKVSIEQASKKRKKEEA